MSSTCATASCWRQPHLRPRDRALTRRSGVRRQRGGDDDRRPLNCDLPADSAEQEQIVGTEDPADELALEPCYGPGDIERTSMGWWKGAVAMGGRVSKRVVSLCRGGDRAGDGRVGYHRYDSIRIRGSASVPTHQQDSGPASGQAYRPAAEQAGGSSDQQARRRQACGPTSRPTCRTAVQCGESPSKPTDERTPWDRLPASRRTPRSIEYELAQNVDPASSGCSSNAEVVR